MLEIEKLSFAYAKNLILDEISLTIDAGEILCLLGESGSGKTTLLRLIAGLETGYQGNITLDGNSLHNVAVHQRGFGFMFQDFALFPHMNVFENVAFGLKMQGIDSKATQQIVVEMLNLLGLQGFEQRNIDSLSGGQKQRVALARSLAPKPKLLMLDEPLGSLDAGLKERLLLELREIVKQLGLTAIYVTHDQQEAYTIADRIAITHEGHIIQIASPEMLYRQPNSPFVAKFLGISNLVPAEILPPSLRIYAASIYLLHPDGLSLDATGELEGILEEVLFQGERKRLRVRLADSVEIQFNVPSSAEIPNISATIHLKIEKSRILPMSNP